MLDEAQTRKTQRAITALALLFSLLLGFGGAGAPAEFDTRAARLAQNDTAKLAPALRASPRAEREDADSEDALAFPAAPEVEIALVGLRPAAEGASHAPNAAPSSAGFDYRARAPPAAV